MIDFAKLAAPFDPEKISCKGCGSPVPKGNAEYCSRACSNRHRSSPVMDAFMSKVMPEPNSGCWLWTGAQNHHGYGTFWLGGKCQKAHRISHLLLIGPIPAGLDVLHKCDIPSCVNPDHLRAGTVKENMTDMWERGRGNPPARARNPKARLTEDGVQRIRDMAALDYSTVHLAALFGVDRSQIRRVVRHSAGGWR